MIVAGIDGGSKNTRAVVLEDGKIRGKAAVPTGFDQAAAARASLETALASAGIDEKDLERIGGTGAGREEIAMASLKVGEVRAIGRAAAFFFPTARTVVDVGAEKGRVAGIDAGGKVREFAINETCAAGTGAFIEAMARALEVPLEEMGSLALASGTPIPLSAQCAIFAESEVVGLIHARAVRADICRAIHDAMAGRIASMIRRIGVREDVVMLGGVGLNPGFVESLRRELGVPRILVPDDPAFGAAIGAALAAMDEA